MGSSPRTDLAVVILSAGKGTRMHSAVPKVLHCLRGRRLIDFPLALARSLRPARILLVLGHRADLVQAALGCGERGGGKEGGDISFVIQEPQSGTGHAVACCLPALEGHRGGVLVLSGDVPGLRRETVRSLLAAREGSGAPMAMLTAHLADPRGYGRVMRGRQGAPAAVREQKDLAPGEESVREANLGVYAFDAGFLRREIPLLSSLNAQKEYYLTDLVAAAAARGAPAVVCTPDDPREALGINTMAELFAREDAMRQDFLSQLMEAGVRIVDPSTAFVDETVRVAPDAVLHPVVFLRGGTVVERGAVIHPGCVITDSVIGEGCEVRPHSVITGSVLEKGASAGPFAHLRPGTRLAPGARVGNFVEIKKSVLGRESRAGHLSYIGDSQVGEGVNIGAGTVTCNYDGFAKHRTVIEDGVFIGSGTMLVAPVTVGRDAVTAAGSTITRDVPPGALGVARARQENREGFAARRRARKQGEPGKKESI
jgi:bifunctional UDP-N-acetylglucosamine pyrophosphorylase/glucosamine-1-phosphate N-acetyltransferase